MQFATLNLKTTSGPVDLSTSALSDVKEHLKVSSTYEDDLIKLYINAAVHLVETYCSITLGQTTYQLYLPSFPVQRWIELPRGPVSSVTSLYYRDTSNVETLWASADYEVSLDEIPARIYLEQDDVWEQTYQRPDAVQVTYVAGAASWSALADKYKLPIYYLTAHQHRFRQPVVEGGISTIPWALRANLQSLREDFQTG